ncbi:MAG: hypothetical protein ACTHKM_09030 [Tsuneonella sp.]
MTVRFRLATALALACSLAACTKSGELTALKEGVGITAVRTPCPAVGIPDYTGDITTFRTPGLRTAANMDVTATITNLRSTCDDTGAKIYTNATFEVLARRTDTRGARQVTLPYFATVLRGGGAVVSKQVGNVVITFADGQERATGQAQAGAFVERAEATLPDDIRDKITRKRKAGDIDAAVDPLADPDVKAALARATFELLVGFELDQDQFAYNVTR